MSQHVFEPEKELSWKAYQESVYSDSVFEGYEPLLKVRFSGHMTSKAQVGLSTQEFDKAFFTLPLMNGVAEFDVPRVTKGTLPVSGQEGDYHLDITNQFVYRFAGGDWVQLVGQFVLADSEPIAADIETYINSLDYIIYTRDGEGWLAVGNLLLTPLQLWPAYEEIETPGGLVSRSAIPNGTLVRLGDYIFEYDTSNPGGGPYDFLNNPTSVAVGHDTGAWRHAVEASALFQENSWFQSGARDLKLPLHYFDEPRLMGFWLANPDGSFALSTDDANVSPTYRSIAVNDVLPNVDSLRKAGQLGAAWGFGPPDSILATTMYVDVIMGNLYLDNAVVANINTAKVFALDTTPAGFSDGDVWFIPMNLLLYVRTAGTWVIAGPANQLLGDADSNARWGASHRNGQYEISFELQWKSATNEYASPIVLPNGAPAIPTIARNYVGFWTDTVHAHQKLDLATQWPGPWLLDSAYAYSPLDVRIHTATGFQELGPQTFDSYYGFNFGYLSSGWGWNPSITYNQPHRFDSGVNYQDFFRSVTSSYQDLMVQSQGMPEPRLATRSSITFPGSLIQRTDGNWYTTVRLAEDLLWINETAPTVDPAFNPWAGGGWGKPLGLQGADSSSGYWYVETPTTSGELVSRVFDDTDPVSMTIQASCTYKTTVSLPPGYFVGMTSLDWEDSQGV